MSTALQIQQKTTSQEVAASASAALAKATIEAKFVIALQRPRSILTARAAILDACKRPAFAESAMYRKPQGGKTIEGLSIRFAEQALNAWKNVDVSSVTAWEDEAARLVRITVTDLETNLSYSDEVMLSKTVERKTVRDGQEVLGERETSTGGKVFIVRTTDEEMANKVNAAKSKAIRNSGLRLIPQDVLEEAEAAIRETREKGGGDSKEHVKKLSDAFGGIGIPPSELEEYLGHPLEQTNPKEVSELRAIFTAIRDGEARWSDYKGVEQSKVKTAQHETKADKVTQGDATEESPSVKLENLMTRNGLTFDDLRAWGEKTGNIPDPTSLTGFEDIAPTVATRLMRNPDALIERIKTVKGGGK